MGYITLIKGKAMRAVRCCENHVHVVDVPEPAGTGVRVKVRSAGICGSDLHLVNSGFGITATLGHEIAGTLDDGRVVAIEPIVSCGRCKHCKQGNYNLCSPEKMKVLGVALDGGMADELLVPPECIVPLPSGLPAADACLVEPLGVAIHGIRLSGFRPGNTVAIIGGGAIGLAAAAAAICGGARQVAVSCRHDSQREAAEKLGATALLEKEYDIVIEAAGTESSLADAVRYCKPRGTILFVATYWEGMVLPGFELCSKEIRTFASSMYGCQGAVRDVDAASAMLARNPQIASALISHRFPLDAAAEAFSRAANRESGAIKVVLEP